MCDIETQILLHSTLTDAPTSQYVYNWLCLQVRLCTNIEWCKLVYNTLL